MLRRQFNTLLATLPVVGIPKLASAGTNDLRYYMIREDYSKICDMLNDRLFHVMMEEFQKGEHRFINKRDYRTVQRSISINRKYIQQGDIQFLYNTIDVLALLIAIYAKQLSYFRIGVTPLDYKVTDDFIAFKTQVHYSGKVV